MGIALPAIVDDHLNLKAEALMKRAREKREEQVRQSLREAIAKALEVEAVRAPINRETFICGLATRIRAGEFG